MADYPLIEIGVSIGTWSTPAEALPDTGYDGSLIIPLRAGAQVLADADQFLLHLADGSEVEVLAWVGELDIEGQIFEVPVHALGSEYIIGREVLDRMEICFEFGERVRLRFDRE